MPTPPDPAVLYSGVAAFGSLAAALRAEWEGCLDAVPVTASVFAPLLEAAVATTVSHRKPLEISAWRSERRWSIRGTEPFQNLALVDGQTDDLAQVARAARAWHDGKSLEDICRTAAFVHPTGRFEVPDNDPARLPDRPRRRHVRGGHERDQR
ncbi:hypothetical protein [Streptomyces sp. NBC_00572]|uniref:hypothetical protein n=1 Tax=Streptomyces sp. NBC_00572 TaxID=2903664 RepID=UPI00225612B8|nr:hypothetical protein [Streptomyces sp. NBC_00572]MCX4985757.1 hypothetical protein [Streptomyces sp. NBC_00572]